MNNQERDPFPSLYLLLIAGVLFITIMAITHPNDVPEKWSEKEIRRIVREEMKR